MIGEAGPSSVNSTKQKIVAKSSTEAEFVGTSDRAGGGLLSRDIIYQAII